uniref:ShKT domain-containing protein n=1 Tax=Panagrolaimus davidi TaxID=227884 RepID=A0A914P606_9BILA
MSNLPFLNSTDAAKVIIADFLKDDYVCQKVFNFTDNDAFCYGEKLPKSIEKICKRDYSSCNGINEFSNCITKLAYKKCRKYVACFVQKTSTLEKCSFSTCGGCDSISASNTLIKDLCKDDKNTTLENA